MFYFWLGFIFHSCVAAGFAFLILTLLRMIYTFMLNLPIPSDLEATLWLVLNRVTAGHLSGLDM